MKDEHVYENTHNERSYFCKEVDITNLCESIWKMERSW